PARRGGPRSSRRPAALFDLRFLENDVLARDRIELLQFELLGLGARVLFGHVKEAGIGAADELDEHGAGLGHLGLARVKESWNEKIAPPRPLSRKARPAARRR